MTITIIGLGPGDPKYLTDEAKLILSQTNCIYVRSSKDPSLSSLPNNIEVKSFDYFYEVEHAENVYIQIAKTIIGFSKKNDIVYAVPGDPMVGELSVGLILEQAKLMNINTRIVHGVSFFEPLFEAVGYDPFNGIQLIMADELASQIVPNINPDIAALITMIIWPVTTSMIYERLSTIYPQFHPIIVVERAGTKDEKCSELNLGQLEQNFQIHPLSCIFIPRSENPSFQQLLNRILMTDGKIIKVNRKTNKTIDYLAMLDIKSLGETLRSACNTLPQGRDLSIEQHVSWKKIQYIIGRFIVEKEFRKKYYKNPKVIWEKYQLSEREKLLLSILDEWNNCE